ncbi:YceI family protein [Streptacidiphilus sp. PB12-B1b]|uniref:YceI family protein n=1 Tax=Streptacidiphilus sp. PB12-B1b TaxID=2705012 RepID=UPI0015FDF284|nr:YceI family protein [Streptacidiphilus sp. PB12-B1b]QMU75765.1 YceI family protein [Streptacidiphilus sp. PB12-B1b]
MSDSSDRTGARLDVGHWLLDAPASTVGIRHKSMWGLVTVAASFTEVSGEGETAADGSAHGTLTVAAASVASGKSKLDTHLRSADFFAVEQHPAFVFTADRVVPGSGASAGTAEVTGRLTILGTTKPFAFTVRTAAAGPDDVTLSGEVTVDRADFGMDWNRAGMLKGLTTVVLALRFSRR